MEILRLKFNEFNLKGFIDYYNDNIKELISEFPEYLFRICLVDKDYMDVLIEDYDYEELNNNYAYIDVLNEGNYYLHFIVGKTFENAEKIEMLDGKTYGLNHYLDDLYEDDNNIKDIGDLNLNLDNFIGLMIDIDEDNKEIVIYPTDFEHGGEISHPRVVRADNCGEIEDILKDLLNSFI